MRNAPLVLVLALLVAAVSWNVVRFRGAEKVIRAKDLSFLPSPEAAKVLALGHDNSVARLRWIDAFAYLQYQFDRRDDTVAGGGRGFEKLYDTLIALDPRYEPFYQYAALAVGGMLGRHDRELGYLMRGLIELPHDTRLWRHAASVLYGSFGWDERQPMLMDEFLAAWAAAELDEQQRQEVWEWKAAMARRRFHGLEQLPYWLDRLAESKPGGPMAQFIETTIREQLTGYALTELNAVLADRRSAGLPAERIEDALDAARLNARRIDGRWGPVTATADGRPELRADPFGHPYELRGGRVVSRGQELQRFEQVVRGVNIQLTGIKLADIAAVRASGIIVPEPPPGATLRMEGGLVIADLPAPPAPPLALH